ncbi:Na+/H+ antiporter NhaA [Thermodesulfobacteriota bacterium]
MAHQKAEEENLFPREALDAIVDPLKRFLHIESISGILLLATAFTAVFLANSPFSEAFLAFWKKKVGFTFGTFQMYHSLKHWINDGLMAIFFFVVGLEVKRELVMGELRDFKRAALPIAAAIGGMVVPACIYLLLQGGTPAQRGWGVPMATDIAFVVGCMAILGSRIPNNLRILVLSLAIADDIGAILVIAVGYTESLNWGALAFGIACLLVIIGLMKVGLRNVGVYFLMMILVWFGFHESGVHATIAGVICGLMTPTKAWISEGRLNTIVDKTSRFLKGEGWHSAGERYALLRQMERAARKTISPLERFETDLHPWVSFGIMPVFALANAGVSVEMSDFSNPIAIAVGVALFFGKPMGIVLFSWLAVSIGFAKLPKGVGWHAIIGGGFLAGIGFTMALFIAGLALSGDMLDPAKIGIIAGSILSMITGMAILTLPLPKRSEKET